MPNGQAADFRRERDQRHRRATTTLLLSVSLLCFTSPQHLCGQAPSPAQAEPHTHADGDGHDHGVSAAVQPQTEELKQAVNALREHLKAMRKLVVNYHLSESAIEDRNTKELWPELLEKGAELHQQMIVAALHEFQTAPKDRTDIAAMLARLLKRSVDEDRFDGMLPVAQSLLENGYENTEITRCFAMTAFSTNEYEVAKPFLQQLLDREEVSPELGMMLENYDGVKAAWEEELKLRAADAAGEPLPRVLIKTTKGNMEVELFENQAPETVGNFIHLVEQGFYDNLTFHRVLEHFMAQGGCPQGDGQGGPGYFIRNESKKPNARNFFRGTLGMALAQTPDTGGSQFFITFLPTPQLNGTYTAFGRVINGLDVLSNINRINPDEEDKQAAPVMPDEIVTIEILFKRDHPYSPSKVLQQ